MKPSQPFEKEREGVMSILEKPAAVRLDMPVSELVSLQSGLLGRVVFPPLAQHGKDYEYAW